MAVKSSPKTARKHVAVQPGRAKEEAPWQRRLTWTLPFHPSPAFSRAKKPKLMFQVVGGCSPLFLLFFRLLVNQNSFQMRRIGFHPREQDSIPEKVYYWVGVRRGTTDPCHRDRRSPRHLISWPFQKDCFQRVQALASATDPVLLNNTRVIK